MYIKGVLIYLFFITFNSLLKANDLQVNFSHISGYYTNTINLIIEPNLPEAIVFYSVNKPVIAGNKTVYESSLLIDSTTVINAMAVLNEDTVYASNAYLFLRDIKVSNNLSSHITENDKYKKLLDSAFLSLPAICVNTNYQLSVEDTIGPVELPASIVFVLPDHDKKSISVNCGLQTWGGSPSNPKKNYRLEFKSRYGPSKFNFDLFNSKSYKTIKPATEFDKLLLRAGSQDGLNAEYGNEAEAQFIKNRFIYDVVLEMGLPAPHGFFTNVFINNKYAGIYHLMEAADEFFFKTYFFENHKKDSIEIRKNKGYVNQPVEPTYYSTLLAYSNGLNVQNNYQQLTNFINVDAAATYITYHHLFNSFDWSDFQNTLLAAVPYKSDGKFDFSPWDFDFSLGAKGTFTNTYVYDRHGAVPENLFNSAEFKFLQGDKVICYCTNNGVLTSENLIELYKIRANEIRTALIAEAAKWGNTNFDGLNSNVDVINWEPDIHWQEQFDLTVNKYLTNRTEDFIEDYKELNRLTDVLPVEIKYNDDGISLINPNTYGKIVYTLDGTDPRNFGDVLNEDAFVYDNEKICIDRPSKLIARVYATTNIDVRWSNFCPVLVYPEQPYGQLTINEIHYKPKLNSIDEGKAKDYEFIELKNSSDSTIFLQNVEFVDGVYYKFKKGDSIAPKKLLVLASDTAGFKSRYGINAYAEFKGSLNNSGELVTLVDPYRKIIDQLNYTSEEPWPSLNDTVENSIALLNPEFDNALGENWELHPLNFSPGIDNNFCQNNPLSLNISRNNLSCFNSGDGIASASITGGKKPYSILWNTGLTTNVIDNLSEGNYSAIVQDANYCLISDSTEILGPEDISINFIDNLAFVTGGKPPYTYLWSNGETGKKLQTTELGDFKLTVCDSNGCKKEKINTISEIALCGTNAKSNNLLAHNLTITSVILFWNAIAEGSYVVKYKAEDEIEWNIYETRRTSAVLYNLQECTTYYIIVTYKCDNLENGIESDTILFETKGC